MKKFLLILLAVMALAMPAVSWYTFKVGYRKGAEETAKAVVENPDLTKALVEKAKDFEKQAAAMSDTEFSSTQLWAVYGENRDHEVPLAIESRKDATAEACLLRLLLLSDRAYPLTFAKLGYKQYYGQSWWDSHTAPRAPHFAF